MRRKILLTLLVVVFASGCLLNSVGLYTADQYNAQATQMAQQAGQITDLTAGNAELQKKVDDLTKDKAGLEGQIKNFRQQVTDLTAVRDSANADLARYSKMVCADLNWDEVTNKIRVWSLSSNNADLAQIEKDTKVSFFLTQFLPLDAPVSKDAGYYVVVVDFYNGIMLNTRNGCMIFDQTWDFSQPNA